MSLPRTHPPTNPRVHNPLPLYQPPNAAAKDLSCSALTVPSRSLLPYTPSSNRTLLTPSHLVSRVSMALTLITADVKDSHERLLGC